MTKRERMERKEEETEVSACLGAAAWPPGCHCGLVPRRARPLGPPPCPQAPSGRSGRRCAEGTRPAAAVLCPCGRAPPPGPPRLPRAPACGRLPAQGPRAVVPRWPAPLSLAWWAARPPPWLALAGPPVARRRLLFRVFFHPLGGAGRQLLSTGLWN